jgi:hypothetical protein
MPAAPRRWLSIRGSWRRALRGQESEASGRADSNSLAGLPDRASEQDLPAAHLGDDAVGAAGAFWRRAPTVTACLTRRSASPPVAGPGRQRSTGQRLTTSLAFAPACFMSPLTRSPRPSARSRRLRVSQPTLLLTLAFDRFGLVRELAHTQWVTAFRESSCRSSRASRDIRRALAGQRSRVFGGGWRQAGARTAAAGRHGSGRPARRRAGPGAGGIR